MSEADNAAMFALTMADIKHLLTNRYPYLLVDRVTELIPGKLAKGYKNLTANEWYFPVHFPEEPMMPGMLQTEALFQMLTLTVLALEGNAGKIASGISANHLRFRGKRMDIEAVLTDWDGKIASGTAKGLIDGEEACSAEFSFCLSDRTGHGGDLG